MQAEREIIRGLKNKGLYIDYYKSRLKQDKSLLYRIGEYFFFLAREKEPFAVERINPEKHYISTWRFIHSLPFTVREEICTLHNCYPETGESTVITNNLVYAVSANVYQLLEDERYASGVIHYLKKRQLDLQNKEFKYVAYFNGEIFNTCSAIISGLKWGSYCYLIAFANAYFSREVNLDIPMIQSFMGYNGLQSIISTDSVAYRLLEYAVSTPGVIGIFALFGISALGGFVMRSRRDGYLDREIPIKLTAQDQTQEAMQRYAESIKYIYEEIYQKGVQTLKDISAGVVDFSK